MGFFQLLNQLVAVDIVGGETVLCGYQAEGGGQVGLAHAGRSEKHHILAVLQEAHGSQFVDLAFVNGGLEGKIEVIQGLLDRKARHLDLFFIGPFPLGFSFFRKDVVQNVYNVEVLRHGPFQVVVQDLQGVFHLESFQILPQPVHGKLSHTVPRHIWTNRKASKGNQ